jgi:hypothetical protein
MKILSKIKYIYRIILGLCGIWLLVPILGGANHFLFAIEDTTLSQDSLDSATESVGISWKP